jgi:hypothetical protein
MSDTAHHLLEDPVYRAPANSVSCAALLAAATPQLYAGNPFRRLGLAALASTREIARRIDELKLSVELGTVVLTWAFAPESGLTLNEIREAGQKLKIPRDRLVHELFWFWPENYPDDSADEAIAFLARGEMAAAVRLWQNRLERGSLVARHNLAIYHHVLALDTERSLEGETRPAQLWMRAVGEWQRLVESESFWALVRARVQKIADAQLPESFVAEIRAALPGVISQINSTLLVSHAEHSRTERAGLHASLIGLIHRDLTSVRRTLDSCAIPIARRIDAFVASAREAAASETAPPLATAKALIEGCDDDLRLVKALCAGEEAYLEFSSTVADTALGSVVAHQRRTQDDRSCLLLLTYLLNLDVTPELRRRLDETYQVIRTNVLVTDTNPDAAVATFERDHRLIAEIILPQLDTLQLSTHGQKEFVSHLAQWLRRLAVAAWRDHNRPDFAEVALTTALELHCNRGIRAQLEDEWEQLQNELHGPQGDPLEVERHGRRFAITLTEISLDDQRHPLVAVTGVRASGSAAPFIAWCVGDATFTLDAENFFHGDTAAADHAAILEAVHRLLVPHLIAQLLDAIRTNAPVFLGDTALTSAGVSLTPGKNPVPYARIHRRIDEQALVLSDAENPAVTESYILAQVWNAGVIGNVFDVLAHEEKTSAA